MPGQHSYAAQLFLYTFVNYGGHAANVVGRADYRAIKPSMVIADLCRTQEYNTVGDLCSGQGLVPLNAFKAGKRSVCTELNPKRVAKALHLIAKAGGLVEIDPPWDAPLPNEM